MSSGHSQSVGFRHIKTARYMLGQKPVLNRWRDKKVGWFGYAVLGTVVLLFGAFTFEVRQILLAPSGEFASIASGFAFNKLVGFSGEQAPAQANNIVDLNGLMDQWQLEHSGRDWGIVVQSINGPIIDAAVNPNQTFESRMLYKTFLTAAVHNQLPADQHAKTVLAVGSGRTSVAKCLERLIKNDDSQCADAFGRWLDVGRAAQFMQQAGMQQTILVIPARTVQTTAADVSILMNIIEGKTAYLSDRAAQTIAKWQAAQFTQRQLVVACPGCKTNGVIDYGVGRLEAAGTVKYSGGSYRVIVFANGGTDQDIFVLSGRVQQAIQDTIYTVRLP